MDIKFFSTSISVNKHKCLRNDCTLNNCTKCIEICHYDAFSIATGKLQLLEEKCTNCTACIGICPTSAISADGFDPDVYVVNEINKENNPNPLKQLDKKLTIKCSQLGACLSSFDEQNIITLQMRSSRIVEFDLSDCERCPLNENTLSIFEQIKNVISETNRFLEAIGMSKRVVQIESAKSDRRSFLKSIFGSAKSATESASFEPLNIKTQIPIKTYLLKNSLKDLADELELKINVAGFSFLTMKEIGQTCTNCKQCVEFCPTNALFYSNDYDKIYFQSGKCVNCGICNDICKDKSFSEAYETDLVRFMFDKAICLIEHNIVECDHCKIGFASKNSATTCPTCMNFRTDFAGMFLTAEEIESHS